MTVDVTHNVTRSVTPGTFFSAELLLSFPRIFGASAQMQTVGPHCTKKILLFDPKDLALFKRVTIVVTILLLLLHV